MVSRSFDMASTDNSETPPISSVSTLQPAKDDTKRKVSIITDPPSYAGHDNLGFEGPRRKISQVCPKYFININFLIPYKFVSSNLNILMEGHLEERVF